MKRLLLALCAASCLVASEKQENRIAKVLAFHKSVVNSKESIGDLQLLKIDDDFIVEKDGIKKLVKSYDVDPLLKKANKKQLKKYLEEDGYIQVDQLSNADYILKAKGRIRGGGPITAGIFYGLTKAIAYGAALAGAATAVGATGGGAVLVAGAGEVLAVTGSGIVATAIGTSAVATGAAVATTTAGTAVASAGGFAAVMAGIEGAALYMSGVGLALPLP